MDEYNRIQAEFERFIMPIKIICFSFCLMILSQDITMTIGHFNSKPFEVVTKLNQIHRIETPTLSICFANQMNMTKLRTNHSRIYHSTIKYYEKDYIFYRTLISQRMNVQQHLDLAYEFDDFGTCMVLLPNDTYAPCNATKPINLSVSPYRLCYGMFERHFLNDSNFVYNREVLAKKPWVLISLNKTNMRRSWVDVVINGLPRARLCYHGFPGFISVATDYLMHTKIGLKLNTIRKLEQPYGNDCDNYIHIDGCYSRESCIELCYANESLRQYNKWPRNLQTWNVLNDKIGPVDFDKIYFSSNYLRVEHLRKLCGQRFPKSDCVTFSYTARVIEEEMTKRNMNSDKFELYIYSYFESEHLIAYIPSFNSSQLYYEISQSISTFLGFCIFDIYKLFIYLYDLLSSS